MNQSAWSQCERNLALAWKHFSFEGSVRYNAKGERMLGGRLDDLSTFKLAMRNLIERRYSCYLDANGGRTGRLKVRTADIVRWRYVVLDLDPIQPERNPVYAAYKLLDHAERILPGSTQSGLIVYTGRGAQVLLALEPKELKTHEDRADAERAMSGFIRRLSNSWNSRYGYVVDSHCSDLARIVRCPGTIHAETGRFSKVIQSPSAQLRPEAFNEYTDGESDLQPAKHYEGPMNLIDLMPHLTDTAAAFLTEGVAYPGRRDAAYATARSLGEVGVPMEVAEQFIMRATRLCRPRLGIDELEDVQRSIPNAYRKGFA